MFTVIYQFKVKKIHRAEFLVAWSEMTELIKQYEGGLGSRLHLNKDESYLAYAQWPSREKWEASGDHLPAEAELIRKKMRESCESIETIYEMDVVKDLLINPH